MPSPPPNQGQKLPSGGHRYSFFLLCVHPVLHAGFLFEKIKFYPK